MRTYTRVLAFIMLIITMVAATGCKSKENNDSDVRVTTYTPQDITQTTAVCGGDVIAAQGLTLNELGVCWSTEPNPTADDSHLSTTNWSEPYVCTITGLEPGTKYHVRAYALRGLEYYYGDDKSFITDDNNGGGNNSSDVRVTTYTPQDITGTTAKCGGDVIVVQGLSLNELGICWGMEQNPTAEQAHRSTTVWNEPFVCTITDLEPGTKYYVRAYALRGLEYYYGEDKSFTTDENGGSGTHEYVDLGLPSGTLWATRNVGADTPEGFGKYFAWGETSPKTTYSWSTYKYCMGSEKTLTKYCNNPDYGYNGYTDNLTILLPVDDAATANWGSGWCMPTDDQWYELYENTTHNWTTLNGVNGWLLTATNGNTLFLPAAGYHLTNELYNAGSAGHYWLSSLPTIFPIDGPAVNFGSDFYFGGGIRRFAGLTVRPVRSPSQN